MHDPENIVLNVYHLTKDGVVLSATRFETYFHTHQLVSKTPIVGKYKTSCKNVHSDSQVKVKLHGSQRNFITSDVIEDEPIVKLFKVNKDSELKKKYRLNVPTMIRCQNCETNFPTKYQYQRHQCEFNAEKVILKEDVDFKDIEKGLKVKYDCSTCGKQFISRNNLERHEASHDNRKDTVCEYCSKQFVSENRLRIHKENHCKKAGDISKFYRSDVAVWKCSKCNEVFSSIINASYHTEQCNETLFFSDGENKENTNAPLPDPLANDKGDDTKIAKKKYEKIVTELLFQCEFCNRTYADVNHLLMHQRKHTTDKNYNCTNCNEVFDSYATAAKHWLKKCSHNVNFFCLPKLTLCEHCNRTFKSHELLYTHKIKKKHYTLKIHNKDQINNERNIQSRDTSENLDEMIIGVLQMLHVSPKIEPLHDMPAATDVNLEMSAKGSITSDVTVKSEVLSESDGGNDSAQEFQPPAKKKRGRKRKYPTQGGKVKKFFAMNMDGYKKYQCERCIKVFDEIKDLESHREVEHAASFNCDECGQVLHSAKALLIHSRAHKNLKPYICDTCGRSYSQTSHLWQHMRFHQGIKPFACPHEGCEARYTIRPDLKDHIRKVHTRERPFTCAVCGKRFLTGSVYYQHRLIHTNDRRYGCDVCSKRFFRADALNNHKRIHTDERPYPCNVCGREFRQKGDRNKHLRTQHPNVILN